MLAVPAGRGDFAAEGFDHGRALLGGVCEVVVAVAAVVAAVTAVIALVVTITKDDEPPVIQNINIEINQSGSGEINIPSTRTTSTTTAQTSAIPADWISRQESAWRTVMAMTRTPPTKVYKPTY